MNQRPLHDYFLSYACFIYDSLSEHTLTCIILHINSYKQISLHWRRGHSRNIRRGEEGSENWWETFVGLRLIVIYRKVVEWFGLVWLIRDKGTKRLSGFVCKWEKKKREGRSSFGEGSKLMTEGSNRGGLAETMETG